MFPQSQANTAMRLILATASAARREMLARAGIPAQAEASGVDEAALKSAFSGEPAALAQALAAAKARAVAARHPGALVIGADQLLLREDQIFGKPADQEQAAAQLRQLSGRAHTLLSAVCAVQDGEILWSHTASARLVMRPLSEDFIARYLALDGANILGCVGAYRLEGPGAQLFARIEGDYFTILGLPLLPLLDFLRASGALPG